MHLYGDDDEQWVVWSCVILFYFEQSHVDTRCVLVIVLLGMFVFDRMQLM